MFANCLDPQRCRQMRLARTGAADEDQIVRGIQKRQRVELPHQAFIDLRFGKVESLQIAVGREARCCHLVGD